MGIGLCTMLSFPRIRIQTLRFEAAKSETKYQTEVDTNGTVVR